MIRRAVIDDKMRVIAMAKAFHAAAGLPFAFSAPHADALFRASLIDGDRLCLIYAPDGTARGALVAYASQHQFAPVKVASELMWWVDPEHRGLSAAKMLQAYEDWAAERGCVFASMVSLDGNVAPSKLYERRGYVPIERHFMKRI